MTTPDNPDSGAFADDREDGLDSRTRRAMLAIAVSGSGCVAVSFMSVSLLGGRGPRLGLALLYFMIGPAAYWLVTGVAALFVEPTCRARDQTDAEKR